MKTIFTILTLLISLFLTSQAYSKSFNSTPKWSEWQFYGDGLVATDKQPGRSKNRGSLWLSTDWGETQTAFMDWHDLTPGYYKITTYVRAEDVQKGSEGFSFWHFYDCGSGTQSPFVDLYGSYEWRKIEYTINVKGKDLTIWFRIKSPGQVWVDDFSIEKVETGNEIVLIESAPQKPVLVNTAKPNIKKLNPLIKKLYTFDFNEPGHPFTIKNKTGEFAPQDFYNFQTDKMPLTNWSNYDRLTMEIFNPNDNYANFSLSLADDKSSDYWSQLNHNQTLAPGWNKISISLTQHIGERGSHRFQRPVNLAKLTKFFIVINSNSKEIFISKSFLIDNITLSFNPMPSIPENVMAFDFTSHKTDGRSNLIQITTQTIYNEQRGYGFENPKFWRVEDSQYASESLRYTIGLLGGHFKVKLPNGTYHMSLIVDKLGYWDVPFWSDRAIYANGSPVYIETARSTKDFLTDLLRFENIVPNVNDHPYDLYLSKIFRTFDKKIEVTDKTLDLEFKGDATGISLNTLIVWNQNNDSAGVSYKKAFEKRNKEEFDWMTRSIRKSNTEPQPQSLSISIVEPDLYLNPETLKKPISDSLYFLGGVGDSPYQLLQLNSGNKDQDISWKISDFINEKNEKISQKDLLVSDLIYQFTSPNNNHETYLISGKYLKPLKTQTASLKKNFNKYLWFQLKINEHLPTGIFKGEIAFQNGTTTTKLPIQITVLPYTLPNVEFPVGFFGLDPLPYSYFSGKDYAEIRKKYRNLALMALGDAGFTTFTGLPADVNELDELFRESSKLGIKTVYSYGGQFPQNHFDLSKKPQDISEFEFYQKASADLQTLFSRKNWPKIVYTFSDEAGGYSDKVASDIELGKKLKKRFPFMALGGFGSFSAANSVKLNSLFDNGFYSSLTKDDIIKLKTNNQAFGIYNASPGNLDDPRFSFGLGLYVARLNGLSQFLEWHSTAFNNYPYYDFDGREADSVMFYPTMDGKLLPALRFELATEGLHAYRKLRLLENVIKNNLGNTENLSTAKLWLDSIKRENNFYSSSTFMSNKKHNFRDFSSALENHLKNIFLKK
jgi:hypothetical protein